MVEKIHRYPGKHIDITFDGSKCIHSAKCAKGLPKVFNVKNTPWVQPDVASVEQVIAVIEKCPTGALQYACKDDVVEKADVVNSVTIVEDGPLYIRGNLMINGKPADVYRIALCRCGASNNKPFCDNAHQDCHFEAEGTAVPFGGEQAEAGGVLALKALPDGPVVFEGACTFYAADGTCLGSMQKGALCRCGASNNKPFCDGSHAEIDFVAE